MEFTRQQLKQLDTIEQAWDGDELKIDDGDTRVWLTTNENRPYNGDYVVETKKDGKWIQNGVWLTMLLCMLMLSSCYSVSVVGSCKYYTPKNLSSKGRVHHPIYF